jgi:hypothetical protein
MLRILLSQKKCSLLGLIECAESDICLYLTEVLPEFRVLSEYWVGYTKSGIYYAIRQVYIYDRVTVSRAGTCPINFSTKSQG